MRKSYEEHPTDGDKLLEMESRAAALIADLAVFVIRERVELGTQPQLVLAFAAALAAVVTENLIGGDGLHRMDSIVHVVVRFCGFMSGQSSTMEAVDIPQREVGDA